MHVDKLLRNEKNPSIQRSSFISGNEQTMKIFRMIQDLDAFLSPSEN